MPLKFVLDENMRIVALWHAIQSQQATPLDIVRVGDANCVPLGSADNEIIRWAAENGRIILSRDLRTFPQELLMWIESGREHPGLILLRPGISIPDVVDTLLTVAYGSDASEWCNTYRWIP